MKKRKVTYKIIPIFLMAILSFMMISLPKGVFKAYAEENVDHYESMLSDDFDGDKVIVTLTSEYSDVNKSIDANDFQTNSKDIHIDRIEDLTYIKDPSKITDRENFRQIIAVYLENESKQDVLDVIEEYQKLDYVLAAEPSYNYETVSNSIPNDSFYSRQWGLDTTSSGIRARYAWDFSNGETSPRIKVGIFENNVQSNHPDLRIIPGNFTPADGTNADHGTHVAGIIGAISNNTIGIAGIAQVEIALLNRNDFVTSLMWAFNNDTRIVNASFAYVESLNPLVFSSANVAHENAIRTFSSNGGLLITSAGNQGDNTDQTPQFPAGYGDARNYPDINNVISVGAINQSVQRVSGTNYGENSVHIYAPGENIVSTFPTYNWSTVVEKYTQIAQGYASTSGTSMAAPHVTGVAALLLSIYPDLTPAQLKNAILNSAEDITISVPTTDGTTTQAVKKLNAFNAVKHVLKNYSSSMTLKYNTSTANKAIDSTSSYYLEKNAMFKLQVQNAYEYDFTISSSNAITVVLYDENFSELSISKTTSSNGCRITFDKELSVGTYYLKSSYTNPTVSGTVTASIVGEAHSHKYTLRYLAWNTTQHKSFCACGEYKLQAHVARADNLKKCMLCNGTISGGIGSLGINSAGVQLITANGSYILPNGVIVLVEEDIQAYFAETLVFYKKGESVIVA